MAKLSAIPIILWMAFPSFAQVSKSILYKIEGDSMEVIVLLITEQEVKFKLFAEPQGPEYALSKSRIHKIRFSNGREEVYNDLEAYVQGLEVNSPLSLPANNNPSGNSLTAEQWAAMEGQAYRDATENYDPRGAFWGNAAASFLFPPAGLISAIATSLAPRLISSGSTSQKVNFQAILFI